MDKDLLIQKYLKRTLTKVEQANFDKLMEKDSEFKNEVAFLEDFHKVAEAEGEDHLRNLLSDFETEYQPYKKSSRTLWYVAASVIALLGMAYFFTIMQPTTSENLFADNFKPYKNVVHPVVRGAQVLDQKTKAFSTYNNRNYEEAILRFEALYNQTGTPYYLFYQANAFLANNQVEEAIPLLEKHLETDDSLKDKTPWYLAMAYLKLQDNENARRYLKIVVDNQTYRNKKAQELLEAIE